jgi:hypothetical protein
MTALGRLVMVCFRDARNETTLIEALLRWADAVREVIAAPNGPEALAQVMRYIVMVNDRIALETLQAVMERAAGPEAKDIIMTLGEQLIAQGVEQGEARGILKGERRLLLRQLRQRFGSQVDADIEQRVTEAPEAQIEAWGTRLLSAATLVELLAD